MRVTRILPAAAALFFVTSLAAPAAAHDVGGSNTATVAALPLAVSAVQQVQDPPKVDVNITQEDRGTVWYTDPVWIALGAIALLVLIVLVVMAARSGNGRDSTTVVR
ncbi:MAG: hypothetical protein ACT4R6_02365 [Gemmatimonadaceae bacterium]